MAFVVEFASRPPSKRSERRSVNWPTTISSGTKRPDGLVLFRVGFAQKKVRSISGKYRIDYPEMGAYVRTRPSRIRVRPSPPRARPRLRTLGRSVSKEIANCTTCDRQFHKGDECKPCTHHMTSSPPPSIVFFFGSQALFLDTATIMLLTDGEE